MRRKNWIKTEKTFILTVYWEGKERKEKKMLIKEILKKEAKEYYNKQLSAIDEKVEAFYIAEYIKERWIFEDFEHEASTSSIGDLIVFPVNVYLKLSQQDDLCTECMFFLEAIESEKGLEFNRSVTFLYDALAAFGTKYITIHFLPHAEGRCRTVNKVRTEFKEVTVYEGTEVVCL